MGLKIKWNDDRVRGTTAALLLIARDRLARGETDDLIRRALADFSRRSRRLQSEARGMGAGARERAAHAAAAGGVLPEAGFDGRRTRGKNGPR